MIGQKSVLGCPMSMMKKKTMVCTICQKYDNEGPFDDDDVDERHDIQSLQNTAYKLLMGLL